VSLETYKRKRDFRKTPEPAGQIGKAPSGDRRFVVQRHRATRLHYDFRLEIDGVLMSWAVPKGPSLDPSQRRMAIHVEDHPLDYFDFEGTIPKGEYGGGDVIVWDWGTWEPEETDDPGKAVRDGELKFRLNGQKLRGRFTLVRTGGGRPGWDSDKEQWLLLHKKDDDAVPGWDIDDHPASVKSGRTNDEVLAGADAVWDSSAPAAEASIDLAGAKKAPLPDFIDPMKATLADRPFTDPDWLFELKLDGYRVEAVVAGRRVQLWTRNKQDGARYFPDLAAAAPSWIRAETAIVDGEVVALNEDGEPSFSLLQDRAGMGRFGASGSGLRSDQERDPKARVAPITYFVFDLLYLDGRLLLDVPLEERKKLLRSVLREHPIVRYGSHIDAEGEAFYKAAKQRGLEGIMAKERHSHYQPGARSRAWLKLKIRKEQELVVVGYEEGKGSHSDLGSLIVGVYEDGELRFAGHVGSGIDSRTRRELVGKLDALRVDKSPLADPPRIPHARCAKPEVVIRAEFAEWTTDGLLRQAAYKGLEIGKDPKKVVRERPMSTTVAAKAAEDEVRAAERKTASRSKSAAGRAGSTSSKSTASRDAMTAKAEPKTSSSTSTASAARKTTATPPAAPKSVESRAVVSREMPSEVEHGAGSKAARSKAAGSKAESKAASAARSAPSTTVSKSTSRAQASGSSGKGGKPEAPVSFFRDPDDATDPPQAATEAEMAALEEMPSSAKAAAWSVGGHDIPVTNLDKVLFPDPGYTKRDLIRYYVTIAPVLLPHLRDRPLNLSRWPDGVTGHSFWQKEIPKYAPDWMARWDYPDAGSTESHTYIVADRVATLAWLANHAAIDLHPWTSRITAYKKPTYALIDIDPGDKTTWDQVLTFARLYHAALGHLGVEGFPKVTGKRGIQIWVPVKPAYTYRQTSDWVEGLSRAVGQAVPDLVSWEWAKTSRRGLARLDYTQNAINKTLVAPYAVRPAPGAPVSAPITWDELDDPDLRPDRWDIHTVLDRVRERGDRFAGVLDLKQTLPKVS
jgi:bifunctional non-homologous end joining protein LigD